MHAHVVTNVYTCRIGCPGFKKNKKNYISSRSSGVWSGSPDTKLALKCVKIPWLFDKGSTLCMHVLIMDGQEEFAQYNIAKANN